MLGVAVLVITVLFIIPIFGSPEVPGWAKFLIALPFVGGCILLAVVIKDRYQDSKHDKYKDIEL